MTAEAATTTTTSTTTTACVHLHIVETWIREREKNVNLIGCIADIGKANVRELVCRESLTRIYHGNTHSMAPMPTHRQRMRETNFQLKRKNNKCEKHYFRFGAGRRKEKTQRKRAMRRRWRWERLSASHTKRTTRLYILHIHMHINKYIVAENRITRKGFADSFVAEDAERKRRKGKDIREHVTGVRTMSEVRWIDAETNLNRNV